MAGVCGCRMSRGVRDGCVYCLRSGGGALVSSAGCGARTQRRWWTSGCRKARDIGDERAVPFLSIGAGLEIARGRVVGFQGLPGDPRQPHMGRYWHLGLFRLASIEGSPAKLRIVVPSVKKSTYFEPTTRTSLSVGLPLAPDAP